MCSQCRKFTKSCKYFVFCEYVFCELYQSVNDTSNSNLIIGNELPVVVEKNSKLPVVVEENNKLPVVVEENSKLPVVVEQNDNEPQLCYINYKKELQGLVISNRDLESHYYNIHSALLNAFLN